MKLLDKFKRFFSRREFSQGVPKDETKLFADTKERLTFAEQQSRSANEPILTEIPKEEIELMEKEILAERLSQRKKTDKGIITSQLNETATPASSDAAISSEVYPKKCKNCPDHKNYFEGEIHQCPDCGAWICGRHYHGHVMKYHKSKDYTISGSESGSESYKIK